MCEHAEALELIHKWLHKSTVIWDKQATAQAEKLEDAILQLVNEAGVPNGVKIVALFAVLHCGVLQVEEHFPDPPEAETPPTIQ